MNKDFSLKKIFLKNKCICIESGKLCRFFNDWGKDLVELTIADFERSARHCFGSWGYMLSSY